MLGGAVLAGAVAVGVTPVSTTSWGAVAAPASRLRRLTAVVLGSVIASVTVPLPVTALVASMATQPLENPADDPAAVVAGARALGQVIRFSAPVLAATAPAPRPPRADLVAHP